MFMMRIDVGCLQGAEDWVEDTIVGSSDEEQDQLAAAGRRSTIIAGLNKRQLLGKATPTAKVRFGKMLAALVEQFGAAHYSDTTMCL